MSMPKKVMVAEVCPRDGWQNHPVQIPTEKKIEYIKKMIDYGARKIEITSCEVRDVSDISVCRNFFRTRKIVWLFHLESGIQDLLSVYRVRIAFE